MAVPGCCALVPCVEGCCERQRLEAEILRLRALCGESAAVMRRTLDELEWLRAEVERAWAQPDDSAQLGD